MMKKIFIIALVLSVLCLSQAATEALNQNSVQQENQKLTEQLKQTQSELESINAQIQKAQEKKQQFNTIDSNPAVVPKDELQIQQQGSDSSSVFLNPELTKEQKKQLERQQKEAEKEKKALEKTLRKQLKEQERIQKEEQKRLEEEQKQAQQQELLAAQQKCDGAFLLDNYECGQCSENCERCSSATQCDICQPGFYRVIEEKRVKSYCSSTIPVGYLPQLKKFQAQNPQILFSTENYNQDAIALDGKKPVFVQSQSGLPYTIENDQPVVEGKPVRVDVVPCLNHCKECPEGYISQPNVRGCLKKEDCTFPDELIEKEGSFVCQENDPSVWKGQIRITKKDKMSQNPEIPSQVVLSLQAETNQQNSVSLLYTWGVYDAQEQNITDSVLPKGNLGKKVKLNATTLTQGQTYYLVCQIQNVANNETLTLQSPYVV